MTGLLFWGEGRGWYTFSSLLEGGEFGDHGSMVTCISGDQELWRGGTFGPAISFLLTLERRVCSQVKKEDTVLAVCKLG